MTSGIDSDLLSDLGSRPTEAVALFELDIAGTTRKYSETWAAASTGLYEGYIIDSGEITRSVSDDNFQLPRDQARVKIFDENRALLKPYPHPGKPAHLHAKLVHAPLDFGGVPFLLAAGHRVLPEAGLRQLFQELAVPIHERSENSFR